jgi:hypothetical protein
LRLLLELTLTGCLEMPPDVVAVPHDQHDRQPIVDGLHTEQTRDHCEGVHHQEVAEILSDHTRVDREVQAPATAPPGDQHRDRDHHHRERRQHERCAEDRAGTDLLT